MPEDEAQSTGFFAQEYRVCQELLESCVQLRVVPEGSWQGIGAGFFSIPGQGSVFDRHPLFY